MICFFCEGENEGNKLMLYMVLIIFYILLKFSLVLNDLIVLLYNIILDIV